MQHLGMLILLLDADVRIYTVESLLPLGDRATGCPKVCVYFDTPLFSGLGGQTMKPFYVVNAECGRFFEV